ncbi:adenosylcobinamide-GDP ribazoletransferase [Tessaracoccus sp.]|uniref:adenosylcobinamide-GDP ribazoletransferase n=1 Tax=Tessaracoccus sp. TaxID=1971211 RepID=UPI002602BEF6|nr:adenosylcobinamide-GDP ribazoletransferase [Tessaracoccus sp.]
MRSLHAAVGLFTVFKVPSFDVDRTMAARAMRALPWVGLLLGVIAGVFAQTIGGLVGPALALAIITGATGGLHLDGLADTADGLGSRKPADEALVIMKRSDIGPMGVIVLVLVLLIDLAALVSFAGALVIPALAGALAAGRAAVQVASVRPGTARPGGFGALFAGVTRGWEAAVNCALLAAVVLAMAWWVAGLWGVVTLAVGLAAGAFAAFVWGSRLVRQFGGWTGDTFGSLIEVTQCAVLVGSIVAASWLVLV